MSKKHDLAQHAHLNLMSSFGRQQGTVRPLNPEQMNRFRHLIPSRLLNPQHQLHEGSATPTAVQRVASLITPYMRTPGPNLSTIPFRSPTISTPPAGNIHPIIEPKESQ